MMESDGKGFLWMIIVHGNPFFIGISLQGGFMKAASETTHSTDPVDADFFHFEKTSPLVVYKIRRLETMDQEKRKRTRAAVHFDVSILIGGELIHVELINISLSGILCTSHPLFQAGAPCKVILSLSEALQITFDAGIARVEDKESAISFTSMDDESFIHLKRIVQYNAGDADLIDKELHVHAFVSK
jgi:hypothetical protein